jgi:hydrogenase expression/formation protein HypC
MCLAYPMKVVSVDGTYAEVEAQGVRRKVGLALLPDAKVGDDVLIHAGYAISLIDPEEAEETREMFHQMWALEQDAAEGGKDQ